MLQPKPKILTQKCYQQLKNKLALHYNFFYVRKIAKNKILLASICLKSRVHINNLFDYAHAHMYIQTICVLR